MPKVNNISISDAEFTAMQELATAFICQRAFKDNKKFNSPEDIIKDKTTKKGLEDIFKYQGKSLLKFELPIQNKTVEDKWLNTFYLQQKKLLSEATKLHSQGNLLDAAKYYQLFLDKGYIDPNVLYL